jgi:hypothetical protein
MSGSESEATFDPVRQAELARVLAQLDARPPLDRSDVFARAERVLPPPAAVARVLESEVSRADSEPPAPDHAVDSGSDAPEQE